jgi:hypothetical protein
VRFTFACDVRAAVLREVVVESPSRAACMQPIRAWRCSKRHFWRAGCGLLVFATGLLAACQDPALDLLATPTATESAPPPAETTAPPPLEPGDQNPLQPLVASASQRLAPPAEQRQLGVVLNILHVLVPRHDHEQTRPLWSHLREDVCDATTAWRLERNGLRVGVGHARWWDAIQANLDAITGVRSITLDPVRLPPSYPLALELDTEPREQTLFYLGDDGILTGETWPDSRNVLRISYELNLEQPDRLRLVVVPEVRQKLDGWRWTRNQVGLVQVPNYNGRAFGMASVVADLDPGEFLLVAPSDRSQVAGLVGNRFLVRDENGRTYDSLVFLRAEVSHVAQRD